MTTDRTGRYLYVAEQGEVIGLSVGSDGVLTPVPGSPFSTGVESSRAHSIATFPPMACLQRIVVRLHELILKLRGMGPPRVTLTPLDAKLQLASVAADQERPGVASNLLQAFINEVSAQSGKKLTVAQATELAAMAASIRADLVP